MQLQRETAPLWMVEFDKQLRRGKHVLLYGNVQDRYLLPGGNVVVSLAEFLNRYFTEAGYELVGRYDIVDGVQFADPAAMGPLFERVISDQPLPTEPPPPRPPRESPPDAVANTSQLAMGAAATERRLPGGGAAPNTARPDAPAPNRGPGESRHVPPGVALPVIRRALAQPVVSTAMSMAFSDKLFSDPQRQDQQERQLLVQLKKILEETPELRGEQLAGRRNAMILIASQLSGLPSWFYQDHPLLALVHIPLPGAEEREQFVGRYLAEFQGGRDIPPHEAEQSVQLFAELTEGLTIWDLMAIGVTSVSERLSIDSPTSLANLISYYKYGEREDPWEKFNEDKVRNAPALIEQRVIGQSDAVEAIVDMLVTARIGITLTKSNARMGKPKGVFFFVGPTGVGKTELAKALTELIFGDENRMQRFDMSEYAEQHAAEKLTGSPPGYVGYEEGGQLTNYVRENPFSVLLFDEIEKADGRVMDKFLQILEDGRLTDSKGQTAYFSQTVIIFTSNIGAGDLGGGDAASGALLPYQAVRDHFLSAVRKHFETDLKRPEILNRFGDNVLVFDLLRPEFVLGICDKFLDSLILSAREKRALELRFPEPGVRSMVSQAMAQPDNLKFGGRRIRTLLEEKVEKPLNRWIFWNNPQRGAALNVTFDDNGQLAVETATAK